jgi:DNA-directed RNA polymerase specialized sigma24 family protein
MLKPQKLSISHEELFIERYPRLITWALQLSENSRDVAEDLVHDAFVHFTFTRPDLENIHNLDGYLYGILRNLRLLQVRRARLSPLRPMSIVEFDSAEIGIRAMGFHAQLRVQDELRMVCQYVRIRKDTSKVGSALILRFFHGYFSGEIAQIMQISRRAVNERLRVARAEAKLFLADEASLSFLKTSCQSRVEQPGVVRTMDELLHELRRAIFESRRGECPSQQVLADLYRSTAVDSEKSGVENGLLAHLVSCRCCLDEVNKLLGLPLLNERYPNDMLGPDTGSTGGSSGGPFGGTRVKDAVNKCRRRADEVFDHKPQELRISVNGEIYIWHKINSPVSEQSISLNDTEAVTLVEVTSEQDIRLMLLAPDVQAPGPVKQFARIALSEDRSLEVTIDHEGLCPVLHVAYRDPTFGLDESVAATSESKSSGPIPVEFEFSSGEPVRTSNVLDVVRREINAFRFWGIDWRWFLKPGFITALSAAVLFALWLVLLRTPQTSVSADALLRQSIAAEQSVAARTKQVIHRTINFEQKSATGTVAVRRIEEWQSAERGVTARRLYDEKGQLLAGDWRRRDGVQTIYHHSQRPRLQLIPDRRDDFPVNPEEVWQWDLSAVDFSRLVKSDGSSAQVQEQVDSYVITWQKPPSVLKDNRFQVLKATVILAKTDLHATQLTLLVAHPSNNTAQTNEHDVTGSSQSNGNDGWTEYRLTEASFERRAAEMVAPSVFDPEVELLGPVGKLNPGSTEEKKGPTSPSSQVAPAIATSTLEVEVLRLLSAAQADLGEQISVVRTPEGLLRVDGLVETSERKSELLRNLRSVASNPAVQIRITTVAAELGKQKAGRGSGASDIIVEDATTQTSIPLHDELQRYFALKGAGENGIEPSIQRFAARITKLSYTTVQRAMALKRLAGRFSADDLRTMDDESRAKWLALVRAHAQTLQGEILTLQRELAPVLGAAESGADDLPKIVTEAELMENADRLFALCWGYDRVVHAALTLSPDASSGAAIKSSNFWQSLKSAESLAARIQSVK